MFMRAFLTLLYIPSSTYVYVVVFRKCHVRHMSEKFLARQFHKLHARVHMTCVPQQPTKIFWMSHVSTSLFHNSSSAAIFSSPLSFFPSSLFFSLEAANNSSFSFCA